MSDFCTSCYNGGVRQKEAAGPLILQTHQAVKESLFFEHVHSLLMQYIIKIIITVNLMTVNWHIN